MEEENHRHKRYNNYRQNRKRAPYELSFWFFNSFLADSDASGEIGKRGESTTFFKKMGETYRALGNKEDFHPHILGTFLPGPRSSCSLDCDVTKAYDFEEIFFKFATNSGSSKVQKLKKDVTIASTLKEDSKRSIPFDVRGLTSDSKPIKIKAERPLDNLPTSKILEEKKFAEDIKKFPGGEKSFSNSDSIASSTISTKEAGSIKKPSSGLIENGRPKASEKEKGREPEEISEFDSEEERKTLLKLKEFLGGYYLDSWVPSQHFTQRINDLFY
jgi:hypothetical protein